MKQAALALLALAVLSMSGCQSTGGNLSLPSLIPTSSSSNPSERTYSLFYDQGTHLRDLVKQGQFEDAARLYAKYRTEFFDTKAGKFDKDLDDITNKVNEQYRSRFESAIAALQANPPTTANTSWRSATKALANAGDLIQEFSVYQPLMSGSRSAPLRDKLTSTLLESKNGWTAAMPEAFSSFSLQEDFFGLYPVKPDSPGEFLAANYGAVEKRLESLDRAAIARFYATYRNVIDNSNSTGENIGSKLAKLYIDKFFAENSTNTDKLKTAMAAVESAKKDGLSPSELQNIRVAFVEATSKTLLKEGQIEFPVSVEIDLPFKTTKTTIDEALGEKSADFDYVIAVEVSLAKNEQRAQKREQMASQYLDGYQKEPNPAYESARLEVVEAQQAVASNDAQFCQGYGCLGKALAAIPLAVNLKNKKTTLNSTPMTLTKPIYKDYEFSVSDVTARKAVTAYYYIINLANKTYLKSTFDIGEEKKFRLAYNLKDKDKNLDAHLKSYDREEAINKFTEMRTTVKLSDVLTQYTKNSNQVARFGGLAALRSEMLIDKNKALAAHKVDEEDKSASTAQDPRFDSVLVIHNPKGSLGSGFYVKPDLVLTNYHVVDGVQFVEMKLHNGLETFGKVVKSDVRLDLALIKVQARGAPLELFGGSIPLGSTVEAIGHPQGLEFTITRGIVSAVRKRASPFGIGGKEVLFVQTDTPINPGNSGGPLFLGNKVIAVNDNKFSAKGIEGIAFSVHYTEVKDFLRGDF